jgi:hypothetical protein
MAYTLAQFAQLADRPLKKAVVNIFRRDSSIMDMMTFESSGTLTMELLRTLSLPQVNSRRIGEAYGTGLANTESLSERICLLGAYIDIPKELVLAKNQIVNQRAFQTDAQTKSIAYTFNDMFINGSPVVNNGKDMVGLWYRLTYDISGQAIQAGASGLDVSPDASTLSTQQAVLIDKIHELIHACDDHKCDALLMNSTMYLRLNAAIRALGMFASSTDSFGRKVDTFGEGGPRLVDVGYKYDQTSLIIGNVETTAGALTGGASTSIYAVKLGGAYLNGWQFTDMEVEDMGRLESGISYRTLIDWGVGIYFYNPRSIARLYAVIAA